MAAGVFEVPVAAIYAVALGALMAWQLCVGMRYGWKYTLGGVLSILSDAFIKFNIKVWRFSSGHPLRWIGHRIEDANESVYRGLTHGEVAAEHAMKSLLASAGAMQAWIVSEIAAWGDTYLQGLNDLVHRDIPAARDDAIRVAQKQFHGIDATLRGMRHWVEVLVTRRLHTLDHLWQHRLAIFRRGIDRTIAQATRPLTRTIARTRAEVAAVRGVTVRQARRLAALERLIALGGGAALGALRARVGRLEGRVGRLERAGARALPGTIAEVTVAAVAAALGRMGLNWLRCRNVKRAGAATCALPLDALEDLLTVGALVGGSLSLIAFAREMESVVETMDSVVLGFWEVG